jgi:DNA-binding NarL/FixJ family response regulator
VLAELKADPGLKNIPVVVLTTSDSATDVGRACDLNANCYITKPAGLEDFVTVMKSIQYFWSAVVRLPERSECKGENMLESQVKVLLIEDNPGDARLVTRRSPTPARPFRLTQVSRLVEGLRLLGERQFDVVLLDLLLEDTSRLGTLMEIWPGLEGSVVVLTGLDDATISRWVLGGAQGYLIKDQIDGALLRHSILDAVDRHGAQAARSPST